jgi:alanine-alpha-ketoisovalerate/valine-pyruvate aminotransferase
MRNIQPLDIWSDGDTKTATSILLYISYDDLATQAALVYKLFDTIGNIIYEGQLLFTGQEYTDWGNSGDSNAEAYTLAAAHLNITLA